MFKKIEDGFVTHYYCDKCGHRSLTIPEMCPCCGEGERGERMTETERKEMMHLADTIQGEINRMCVTKELVELNSMYLHAKINIEKLAELIYNARFKEGEKNG